MFALKTGIIVQGMAKLAFQTEGRDAETVNHLRSEIVWARAAEWVPFPVGV